MSKVLKIAAVVAGIALAIPTGGTSLLALGLGVSATAATAIVIGLTLASSLLAPKPKAPKTSAADRNRLFASIDPQTPRKIVYGRTAMATDIRDQEYTGADDEYFHRFMVVASHKVHSIEEIWFDDKLAWTVAGGVQGDFAGYLTVAPILEGSAANAINISARMGTTRRYTGLAYVHFRYKLTGNSSNASSPFSQSIPTRVTIIGEAMELYDPRKDSTRGGSGAHRIDDQSTWEWDDDACRNPALQLLNYLIGYKINGKLAVGKGIPAARIDVASFATAANACDETITLAAGGSEPRYRSDGIFSEADPMELVVSQYKSSMNAISDDAGGLIRVIVLVNDLGSPIADFDESDILGAVDWKPGSDLSERFNIVKGSHTDPSTTSLYQSVEYPEQSFPSIDDIDRTFTVDFPLVQSVTQCQRLAKQRLQRAQYGGILSFVGQATFWKVLKNDVVRLTFAPLGMSNKLFRVVDVTARQDGTVPIVLREEDASIYAWDTDESAALQLAAPDSYNYQKNPLYEALAATDADIATLIADLEAALALAASRGKVWTSATIPSTAESNVGDTWIAPDGVFYDRVPGGILLDGFIVVLDGFRPSIYWTASVNQPLRDTIAAASNAQATADTAVLALSYLDDDGVLTVDEKIRRLIPEDAALEQSYATITATAGALSISTVDIAAARADWIALRDAISPAWDDITQNSTVTRNSLDAALLAYRDEFAVVQAAIEAKAATLASWSLVDDDDGNRPEDGATRNKARGDYAAGTEYLPGDSVVWTVASGGTGHNYTRIGVGGTTGTAPSDGTKWALTVERGEAGGDGAAGADGADGSPGLSVFEGLIFKRSATAPATPTGGSYDFGTSSFTPPSGWSVSPPAGTDPVYTSAAIASKSGTTGSASFGTWSSPIVGFQDGTPGDNGVDGLDGADGRGVNIVFRRSAAQPATPSASAGVPAGWYDDVASVPAGADPIWSSVGKQPDSVSNFTWEVPVKLEGQDGADGADGTNGLNSAVVFIYQRKSTVPANPSATVTYTFSTGAISGLNNGWSATVPAGTDPLYVTAASASSTGASDTIATGEWASPTILAQDGSAGADGTDGSDGAPGLNAATVTLYKRAATSPAVPSTTAIYTFSTGVLTGHDNGWTQTIPAGTDPIYAITAAAVGAGTTDTIATGEWSSANIIAQNGNDGLDGVDGVDGTDGKLTEFVFQRSLTAPATPTGNGIPAGWFDDIPAGELPLWMSRAKQELDGTLIGVWDAPIRWSEDDQLLIVATLAAADALNPKVGQRAMTPDGTIYRRVSSTGILLGGFVVTLGGFRPSMKWTAEADQPVVAARDAGARLGFNVWNSTGDNYLGDEDLLNTQQKWSDVDGDGIPDDNADVTAAAQITIDPLTPFDIQANSSGETTSALPQSRTVKVRKGGVLLTAGVSFSQNSVSAGLTITVGASSGVIDLTAAPVAGAIIIDAVYAGVTYQAAILVNRTKAAAITGGGAGSTQFIDDQWANISTTSFVQVTDTGAIVQSNASGELRYSASASYNGAGAAVIKAQYSLDGSTWSDFAAEVSGFAAIAGSEPEPGYVAIAAATKTGLSVSTDYYVRLLAKRSAGSGSLSWFGAGFTIKQP